MTLFYKCVSGAIVVLLIWLLVAFYSQQKSPKAGFILTQQLFQQFDGTKELEKKLTKQQEKQKSFLDSLALNIKLLEGNPSPAVVPLTQANRQKYQQLSAEFTQANQAQYEQASEALWKQINQYVSEYGRQKNYYFIYGADGSGTLMYADSTLNVTKEVSTFINQKYAGN